MSNELIFYRTPDGVGNVLSLRLPTLNARELCEPHEPHEPHEPLPRGILFLWGTNPTIP